MQSIGVESGETAIQALEIEMKAADTQIEHRRYWYKMFNWSR